jgi:hypothetical protein
LYRPPFELMFNGPFDKVSWMSYICISSVWQCHLCWPQSCFHYVGKTASAHCLGFISCMFRLMIYEPLSWYSMCNIWKF